MLSCNTDELLDVYPHWHYGYDRVGRPVLYKQYGRFEITKAKELTDLDTLVRYHVWEQEACMLLCEEQSRKLGVIVETITVVIDIKDMQMRQVNRDFLSMIKRIADIDQRLYPETLGALYIINAPSLFPFVWRVVKEFIDAKTAEKIHILSKESEWRPVLESNIGLENMPSEYGGQGEPLASQNPYTDVHVLLRGSWSPSKQTACRTLTKFSPPKGNIKQLGFRDLVFFKMNLASVLRLLALLINSIGLYVFIVAISFSCCRVLGPYSDLFQWQVWACVLLLFIADIDFRLFYSINFT
jgi:hypothetical protein